MDSYIQFFVEVGKLKFTRRPGWLLRNVKEPETVADHSYRVVLLAWVLGKGKNLNIRRLLKLALVHSLSAVRIDYISPYDKLLDTKNKKELLKKYPALVLRAPVGQKGRIVKQRFEEEKKVVREFTKNLPNPVKHEINFLWEDFQQKQSKEAKFLWVVDKLENLIQALEYRNQISRELIRPFLLQIREITNDKEILNFVDALDKFFSKGEQSVKRVRYRNLIRFSIEIGKLKKVQRRGWVIRGIKNAESIASHCYVAALLVWIFAKQKRLNQEVLILMALLHDVFASVIGDTTPYDKILRVSKNKKKLFETLPWLGSPEGKRLLSLENMETDSKALDKVVSFLPPNLRNEAKYFWLEYKTGVSREARFARQVDRIESVIQAMEYQKENKSMPVRAFWLELKELIDDPLLADFVEHLDVYFLQKSK
jgi:putative hydrolase of HD superfamily